MRKQKRIPRIASALLSAGFMVLGLGATAYAAIPSVLITALEVALGRSTR
jgi:hypothetical protein